MNKIRFIDDDGTFELDQPEDVSGLYFPLASESGLKSAVTPDLGGDCKLDQESFLLEPAGIEDLHERRATRNFWCITKDGAWSAIGVSAEQEAQRFTDKQDRSKLTAGFMWQTVCRESESFGLSSEITSFIPPKENVEIMCVKIINTSKEPKSINCVGAIPIYGRSADNLRDHRNVTSMLHRIRTNKYGVQVKPTMSFDEKGHRENSRIYYVMGATGEGDSPESFYPTVEHFIGEGGTFLRPRAVCERISGVGAGAAADGREAMGGIAFAPITLRSGESAEYIILLGITEDENDLERIVSDYGMWDKCSKALTEVKEYWQNKVNVRYHTGLADFDRLLRWISFQPILRRLFGCSFLPHHDYGRGGRGWRDLWQDCLSLLLMDPDGVGDMIRANFGGVRIDGTNATIIGEGMVNTWNAYNSYITFTWFRAASFIYCGLRNGYGYRDTVQDIQGVIHLAPEEAANKLRFMLSAQVHHGGGLPLVKFSHTLGHEDTPEDASYVKETGHPAYRADDALWLFPTIYKYIAETGNIGFLDEVIPFADRDEGTVYEHLKRALVFSRSHLGPHGMPAGLYADWNDCLRLGAAGESSFVAFQFYYAYTVLGIFAEDRGDKEYLEQLKDEQSALRNVFNQLCWNEDQFIRGFTETGDIIGERTAPEASLWLNPQSWAVISGFADKEQAELAMDRVHERLNTPFGAVLMDPPYHAHVFDGALAAVYNAGVKENAGVFSQSQGWLILAEALLGHGE